MDCLETNETVARRRTHFEETNSREEFGEQDGDKTIENSSKQDKSDPVEKSIASASGNNIKLNHFAQQPAWLRDNHFLHNNHRAPTESYLMCVKSCFMLHTETMNIWTHLIPCFLFIFLIFKTMESTNLSSTDRLVISGFLLGAFLCHSFSTAFHTFICHSEKVGKFFQKLDYVGICLLITMSFLPFLHFGFYQNYFYANTYLASVVTLGLMSVWFSLDDKFGSAAYRPVRAIGFAIFGLFGIVPGLHWLSIHYDEFWASLDLKTSFLSLILMGVLYIIGASLYACRIPERFFPGRCDIYLHSHQIFHVLVTLAALVHYYGINILVDHVRSAPHRPIHASSVDRVG